MNSIDQTDRKRKEFAEKFATLLNVITDLREQTTGMRNELSHHDFGAICLLAVGTNHFYHNDTFVAMYQGQTLHTRSETRKSREPAKALTPVASIA